MTFPKEEEVFLSYARKNRAKFSFMIWDYFVFPEFLKLYLKDRTLLCSYDRNNLVQGTPNIDLLDFIEAKGEFIISFDDEWKDLIKTNFRRFKLLVESSREKEFNTFLCMKLPASKFKTNTEFISTKIKKIDSDKLEVTNIIHLNRGLGGVGILEGNEYVAYAFLPHLVLEEEFSFGILRNVWVKPSFRGRGYGFDVSAKMCDLAFKEGVENIYLWVEKENSPAIRIYEKLGFKIDGYINSIICQKNKKR